MADIFSTIYQDALGPKEGTGVQPKTDPTQQSTADMISHYETLQGHKEKERQKLGLPNAAATEEEALDQKNAAMSDFLVGPTAGKRELEAAEDSWSPEYTARGFLEETGNSLARGVGRHFLEGTGDMLQVAGAILPGYSIAGGNPVSKWLQEQGQELSEQHKAYIPEELLHENLDWKSIADPRFWSIHVAEMIPQLVEFVLISKGGAAAAREGAEALAQRALKNSAVKGAATKVASGNEVFGTGSGLIGKMLNTQGLTQTGRLAASTLGGGITGNQMAGMLNAAQVVNEYKDLKDPNTGEPIYTEDELAQLATSTWINNSAWMVADIASFGMTFGGGWKALKSLNPITRGAKTKAAEQAVKTMGKKFGWEVAPAISGLARVAGKAGFEGTEEMFQETFEEWAKQKAVDEMTGNPSSHLLNPFSYWDFLKSKENRGTLVLSAAVGALGGAAFNVTDLINKKADENYKLYNRLENFKQITNKNGTEQELTFQEMHIRKTIADIVADPETNKEVFEEFTTALVENKNIGEDEKGRLEEIYSHMEKVAEKGSKLNVKGMQALLQNSAIETYADAQLTKFQEDSKGKIAELKSIIADPTSTDAMIAKANRNIQEEEELFKKRAYALADMKVKAQRNQKSLILGEKANPINAEIELDEFGNEIIVGLSQDQFDEFTKAGGGKKKGGFSLGRFRGKSKQLLDKVAAPFLKNKPEEAAEGNLNEDPEEAVSEEEALQEEIQETMLSDEEIDGIQKDFGVSIEVDEDAGEYKAHPVDGQKGDHKGATKHINDLLGKKRTEYDKKKAEEAEKARKKAETLVNDNGDSNGKEPISDDTYKRFKEDKIIDQKTINDIAKKVHGKNELSPREKEIHGNAQAKIKEAVAQLMIGTTVDPNIDQQADENIDDTQDAQDNLEDETDNLQDKDINEKEKGFIEKKASENKSTTTLAEKQAKAREEVAKKWQHSKEAVERANADVANENSGFDSREEKAEFKAALESNMMELAAERAVLAKVRKHTLYGAEHISQSQLDNYFNSFSLYNEHGPIAIDKMVAVNHQLRRMFPESIEDPAQVIIVENMQKVLGTQGLGHVLASTIFIDDKVWDQDKVFMHELSHIYYRLAKDTPEVQAIVKMALADKNVVDTVKRRYDDMTIYHFVDEQGNLMETMKRDIHNGYRKLSKAQIDDLISTWIKEGLLKTVPLKDQKYLVEEMFTHVLQTPLANTHDKVFAPKEQRRQKDVKRFWGMLRKRGAIIENNGVNEMLKKLDVSMKGNPRDVILGTFQSVTKGIPKDGLSMDMRAEEMTREQMDKIEQISARKKKLATNDPIVNLADKTEDDFLHEYEDGLENDMSVSYDKEFSKQVKGATKLLKRFGIIYNKAMRKKFLRANRHNTAVDWRSMRLFDRPMFESFMYNLARENDTSNKFILQVENSAIKEVQDFNDYLDSVYDDAAKLQLLTSMYFVFSNSKHIGGFRNTITNSGEHALVNSLHQRELNQADTILGNLEKSRKAEGANWTEYSEAVNNIFNGTESSQDYLTVINHLTDREFNLEKVMQQGHVTYKGMTIPAEVLISTFIRRGELWTTDKNTGVKKKGEISAWNARPIVEALINTNRKFTHYSTVMNAQGNQEAVKVTNNHLMNELDNIIEYLGTNPTLEEFIDRYSHIGSKARTKEDGSENKAFVPNQFLAGIYENYKKGQLPTISQYHGIENINNDKGSTYKESTALEQGIEDFMTFVNSSFTKGGKRTTQYLGNIGTFADSPRKFFMNMPRIKYEDVFNKGQRNKDGKHSFGDGKIINSFWNIAREVYKGDPSVTNSKGEPDKRVFLKYVRSAINKEIEFVNNNSEEVSKLSRMSEYFRPKADGSKVLNERGHELVAEYVLNSAIHGMNVAEVFLPGVSGDNISKRMKANSSPIFSVKNPNFKIEPIFVSDEVIDGSISGTDGGMYITEDAAEKFVRLGKGVMDFNNGFKFLDSHVEKNNPNFKGKLSYLKGYTTVVGPGHWAYPLLKAREDKYKQWHKDQGHGEVSKDLSDGTFNHIAIVVPQSADKSNFMPEPFYDKNMNLTELGAKMTPSALKNSWEHVNEIQDKLFYDKGNFVGLESYNFGPQQVMDKVTKKSNTPVQMINSVLVNAASIGKMDVAVAIQQHIANQKQKELQKVIDKIKSGDIADYKTLIMEGLNRDDMDQTQRVLLEEAYSSIAHPRVNEIALNQLAKTILRAGNKMATDGTLAHQKPDTGYNLTDSKIKPVKTLKGYERDPLTGQLAPAHIVLPAHMGNDGKTKPRMRFDRDSHKAQIDAAKNKHKDVLFTKEDEMNALMSLAEAEAKRRFGSDYEKNMGVQVNEHGVEIGYYVKGDTVIASRVPGHGPSSTGVYEVVGFDNSTEGNQVMVAGEMNEIMGSDMDGDALFIQTKGSEKEYSEWNKAFDLLTQHWLSPEMAEQVSVKMEFEERARGILEQVKEQFPQADEKHLPFSPEYRRRDYNNTMVAKRNIGKIFNLHKAANMLAAYEIPLSEGNGITIGNTLYTTFKDVGKGNDSRNQESAILANIILDNAKHNLADGFGFDEHNMAQATLLVNLGVSLKDTALILNSPAAKIWSEVNRNNDSMFHLSRNKAEVINEIYKRVGVQRNTGKRNISVNPSLTGFKKNSREYQDIDQQRAVLELLEHLGNVNDEVQKVTGVMSGHNKIHVNPFVLEQQLKDFNQVVNNKQKGQLLQFSEAFRTNPDLRQYEAVAVETLSHTRNMSPVYRDSTRKVLQSLTQKIGGDLSPRQIEAISSDLLKFTTARLLGHNNESMEYVRNLIDKDHPDSIFKKIGMYIDALKSDIAIDENGVIKSQAYNNSVLFRRALNINLEGTNPYISANMSFTDESFTAEERERVQQEFAELPDQIQNDLIVYDLVKNGWKSPQSMVPFFGKDTSQIINMMADMEHNKKGTSEEAISDHVLRKLERAIALKHSNHTNSNPFRKIRVRDMYVTSQDRVIGEMLKDKKLMQDIAYSLKPMYISVQNEKYRRHKALYELKPFSEEQKREMEGLSVKDREALTRQWIRKGQIELVPDELYLRKDTRVSKNGKTYIEPVYTRESVEAGIALIADRTVPNPWRDRRNKQSSETLAALSNASNIYEEATRNLEEIARRGPSTTGMDAREDFYIDMFTRAEPLSQVQYERAMEFNPVTMQSTRDRMYRKYVEEKKKANQLEEKALQGLSSKTEEELMSLYTTYGGKDVYAYSNIITPIVKELAHRSASNQAKLWKDKGVQGRGFDGQDVSKLQSYLMTGSTIPSNHPAAQGMVRMLEKEYKTFMEEKRKYVSKMNDITDALYKEKLGYGNGRYRNFFRRVRDMIFVGKSGLYDRLYGNLVIRNEKVDAKTGKITHDFKLRPKKDIEEDFKAGYISKAEKDFYDFFVSTTNELMPAKVARRNKLNDYIPHTSMSRMEALSSRGLLGLMVNSRNEDDAVYAVKMKHKVDGEEKLISFKHIEDMFKAESAGKGKNDFKKILEYRNLKKKAEKLLKEGKNEDGSPIRYSNVEIETALGFGAMNRFTNNRSVKAEEIPSMDLNKALGDYIHATLFVNGNEKFKGMEKLQGYIDGVLAFNKENNLENLNTHVQTVWKDYFLRGKRQESFLGKKADKVIRTLTGMNLFYSLGYVANKNTAGLYVVGNILVGKYHNIKDMGGKAWIAGEAKFWGLDKGLEGGVEGVIKRYKRNQRIMKNLNFMEINIYDEVEMEKKNGLDAIMTDIALMPMTASEKWIQQVHMLGLLTEDELNKFDEEGNYKQGEVEIDKDRLIELEDQVKSQHGRGYQPTDQRAAQMYSWGNMMLQFSKFIPTMIQDRFARADVNIYGQEHIGSLRQVADMVKVVVNNPKEFVAYRNSLSPEKRARLDSGLKGMGMSAVIGFAGMAFNSDTARELYWDSNYYFNHGKLEGKLVPPAIQSTNNLISGMFN